MSLYTKDKRMCHALTAVQSLFHPRKDSFVLFVRLQKLVLMHLDCSVLLPR